MQCLHTSHRPSSYQRNLCVTEAGLDQFVLQLNIVVQADVRKACAALADVCITGGAGLTVAHQVRNYDAVAPGIQWSWRTNEGQVA